MLQEEKYNKNIEGTIFDIQRFSINDGPWDPNNRIFKGLPA